VGRRLADKRGYPVTRAALIRAGVPERYWKASLRAIEDCPHKKRLSRFLVDVHKHVQKGSGLYLEGDFESGKTSAAVALLKEVLRRGGSAYFLKAKDILRVVYDDMPSPDGMELAIRLVRDADLLVLDDLSAEGFNPKKGGGAELEGIVRDRYDTNRSLLVTSNRPAKALLEHYTQAFVNILRRTVSVIKIETAQWETK